MAETGAAPVVLVIEDESAIRRFLRPSLEREGFTVEEAGTGAAALELVARVRPAVILLDLGLPDRDGLTLIGPLRERCAAPIIVLTARGREQDKVQGLDAGADDYLTKPFGVDELLARIRVALRHAAAGRAEATERFESGGLTVDLAARTVRVNGADIRLTPHEYDLLALLVRNAGRVVTQRRILRELRGHAGADPGSEVRLYVHQLRTKLERDPARPAHLITEPGVGYRLRTA